MNRNLSKSLKDAVTATDDLFGLLQDLAVFSLKQAKEGNVDYANQLILLALNQAFYHPGYLISWFETFGKLKWSNKKGKLVNADRGRWLIGKAVSTNWYDNSLNGVYNLSFSHVNNDEKLITSVTKDNFSDILSEHLKENPAIASTFGKFGVPADKNRWGKYKIRIKRK